MTDNTPGFAAQSRPLRVLLVDDHEDLLTMLRLVLSRRGYDVTTASSGAEAINLAGTFAPHIVVSDLGMPGMNGLEMMKRLRGMDELAAFKAIALSGFGDQKDTDSSLSVGFDAHFAKPVDFNHLCETIEHLTK